jgi:hypothetical protein
MADKKKPKDATVAGGARKSSGKGGGKSASTGARADTVGDARQRGEDPSPDNRRRGETARSDRA